MYKRILKYLVLTGFSSLAITAHAVNPGLYMGLQFGPATNDANSLDAATASGYPLTTPADPKSQQFLSSAYIGYKFNKWGPLGASFEGGIYYFNGIGYDTHGVATLADATLRVRSIYFDGKLDYYFPVGIGIFGKAGATVTYLTTSGAFNPPLYTNTYNNKFSPTFSAGVSYDFTQSWVIDASYNTILTGGQVNSVSFYAIGLSYHFVDRYCGQFLCDD